MTTIINGSSPSITFSDGTTQATAGLTAASPTITSGVLTFPDLTTQSTAATAVNTSTVLAALAGQSSGAVGTFAQVWVNVGGGTPTAGSTYSTVYPYGGQTNSSPTSIGIQIGHNIGGNSYSGTWKIINTSGSANGNTYALVGAVRTA
jgi:hypothetical protein